MRRIIALDNYQNLTPDLRVQVFKTVFGIFKKEAKDHLKQALVVDKSIFEGSRYGLPANTPDTLGDFEKAMKGQAATVKMTRGAPMTLDEIFAIK